MYLPKIDKNCLIILGNGFDLHFHLPTKVKDFEEILKTKKIYGFSSNALDAFNCYGVDWSEYENSIAEIELSEIEENNIEYPDYLSDHERDRECVIQNMDFHLESLNKAIYEALDEMVEDADDMFDKDNSPYFNEKELLEKSAGIITFNYTSTAERLLQDSNFKILHIHGYRKLKENLIFGYGIPVSNYDVEWDEDSDFYIQTQKEHIKNFYNEWKKDLQIEKLKDYLCGLNSVQKIIVLGHSLGLVDKEYFEIIESCLQPREWKVSYLDMESKLKLEANAKYYSFSKKIKYFQWQESI